MKKTFQQKINEMVSKEYKKQLNEFKMMGKEYSLDDIKNAGMAAGLSAALLSGLIYQLKNESDADADLANYEQSEEGIRDRQREYDMINGTYDDTFDYDLNECINKVVKNTLKKFI